VAAVSDRVRAEAVSVATSNQCMKCAHFVFAIQLIIICSSRVALADVLSPIQSATITDENGDGVPETVGLGFGHAGDPNYGTTLVQKYVGQSSYERRSVEEFSLEGFSAFGSATLTFGFNNSILNRSTVFDTYLTTGDGQVLLSDFSLDSTELGTRTVPGGQFYSISYDVTGILNSLISSGATYVNVRQEIVGSIVGTNGGDEVFGPQLVVTAAPEADSAVLGAFGIMIVCGFRRYRVRGL